MSRKHSFVITLSNNKTERAGIDFLISLNQGFFQVNREQKKQILSALNLDTRYSRTFDMVFVPNIAARNLTGKSIEVNLDEMIILELKTTQKYLPDLPSGFFFGATENEFKLAKQLKDKFRFCFISLHKESLNHALLTLTELEKIIKNRRIQYQINL